MTRASFDAMILGRLKIPDALASGALEIEGDGSRFAALFAMLDPPAGLMFEVLTPGEGR
jgi:alkyl sulfatase BDS1-like metallo-beta-lactamase superfamily hydrolase